MPAFEQNISILPNSFVVFSITFFISSSLETSANKDIPEICCAVSCAPSKFTSTAHIEAAPCLWKAMQSSLPIPLAAPVTTTFLFFISIYSKLYIY